MSTLKVSTISPLGTDVTNTITIGKWRYSRVCSNTPALVQKVYKPTNNQYKS